MDSCCQLAYRHTFDTKRARQEMDEYLKSGPKKSTNYILDPLREHSQSTNSLMDIGSGVGAIIWELLDKGVDRAVYLEISPGYSHVFKEQMKTRSYQNQIQVEMGDFTELHKGLPKVDIVTLDKVICCYGDYKPLVELSLQKCKRLYAYTIPRNVWWVKAVHGVETIIKSFQKNHLHTLIHSTSDIEQKVISAGFKKIYQKFNREWLTVLYERPYSG